MGAVHCAEGVGHIELCHVCQGFGKVCVVLFFADVKTQIFQQHDLAGLQRGGFSLGVFADDVLGKDDFAAQQLAQTLCHGCQGQLFLPFALGLAQVGAGDHSGVVIQQVLDGGQRCTDALIVSDGAGFLILGDVEITAEQDLFAGYINVGYSFFVVVHSNGLLKLQCILQKESGFAEIN